jgi:hypothetical protein
MPATGSRDDGGDVVCGRNSAARRVVLMRFRPSRSRHPEVRASWRASKDGRTHCAELHPSRRAKKCAHLRMTFEIASRALRMTAARAGVRLTGISDAARLASIADMVLSPVRHSPMAYDSRHLRVFANFSNSDHSPTAEAAGASFNEQRARLTRQHSSALSGYSAATLLMAAWPWVLTTTLMASSMRSRA